MEFKKKSINALGRNKYGDYIGYRRPKTTACEDGVWVLRDVRLIYSDDYTELRANGSNYAQIQGAMDFIVDEDFTADTRTVYMTPKTPDNPHSVYYKIVGDKIYWNDDDFGTTTVNAATYNNLYGAFNGVDYTGGTVTVRTANNAIASVSSEIDYFTTNHGDTEITVGSGETTVFFVAQATRTITFTTTKTLTETVTELAGEGDGKLWIDSNMGSAVDNSVDISTNYSQSAITGWVVVYDDLDSTATSSVTITQEGQPAVPDYLAMDIVSGGTIVWLSTSVATEHRRTIEYSKDSGSTWTSITSSDRWPPSFNVNAGDKVVFRGNNVDYFYDTFSGSTAIYNLSGNICSLLSSTNFDTITALTSNNTFTQIFRDTNVVDASNLKLPAKVLSEGCYMYMFAGCTSLTSAPVLPSTTLAKSCYFGMFYSCTSLTSAPVLSATTLVQQCYKWMFSGCTSLNYVKCLATNISASECTNNWLADVAASGTFVKANSTSWGSGASGIPIGWTVEDNDKVFVNFTEGTYNSTTINDFELEWNIYEGNEPVGAVLYSGNGPDEVPAHQYVVYNWGLDTNAGTAFTYEIPSSEWGTTKTYCFELAVLDYYSGNVLQVNTGTFTATIPASPSGTVTVNAALPDIP